MLVCRVLLITPGTVVPNLDLGTLVQTPESEAVVGTVDIPDVSDFLQGLSEHQLPSSILELFSRPVELPGAKTPPTWHFSDELRSGRLSGSPALVLQRSVADHTYERLGYDRLEYVADAFKAARPESFDGVAGFVSRLGLTRPDEFRSHMSHPVFEVAADLHLRITSFVYSKRDKAYRVSVEAGRGQPLQHGFLSFVPGAHAFIPLSECERSDGTRARATLSALVERPWSDAPLKASLQYTGRTVSEAEAPGRNQAADIFPSLRSARPRGVAADLLLKRFGRSWRQMSAKLRRSLPPGLVAAAEQRMRDALELMEARSFYSIVASGSVVEALLTIRLRRIGPSRLVQRAIGMGLKPPQLKWRGLSLNDSIDAVESLKLMEGLEVNGLTAVREARNHVHLAKKPLKTGFSEADAMSAIGCVLGLLDVLTARGRSLPRPRRSKFTPKQHPNHGRMP
jgi:hypothetical protein